MTHPALLALDGGGSKVDVALLSRSGRVLGAARLAASIYDGRDGHHHSLDAAAAAIAAACADGGINDSDPPIADVGAYCLAGLDIRADERPIARGLRSRGWTELDLVRNDTFGVLRAGSERGWGVAVVCGYGINCSGVAPNGRTFRFPALGHITGDWGGGTEIGEQALWYAMRAEDGRGRSTALERLVPAHFGLRRVRQVAEAIYLRRLDDNRIGELAPLVFRSAGEGDAVSRAIVERQADEIVTMAGTAIRRLHLTRSNVEVVLGGGVFRSGLPSFFQRITAGLREIAPAVHVKILTAPPLVGAALIGLDCIGASEAAKSRARAALTHERLENAVRVRVHGKE